MRDGIWAGQSSIAGVGKIGGHFLNTEVASKVGFGERMIPDVQLTRFADGFVALNADQSEPEVQAAVNCYFVGRTIQAEATPTAGAADSELTARVAKRTANIGKMPARWDVARKRGPRDARTARH